MMKILLFDLAFSGQTLLLFTLSIGAIIAIAIIGVRQFMSKMRDSGNLKANYNNKNSKSPIADRNKYPALNILRKNGTVFNIGLIVSISLSVMAFSWTSYDGKIIIPDGAMDMEEDLEIVPPPTPPAPPPPPPPPPPAFEEVPEEELLEEDEPVFLDQDIDELDTFDDTPYEDPVEEEPEVIEIEDEPEEDEFFTTAEEMPRFPGCEEKGLSKADKKTCAEEEMLKFIYSNIKYPTIARENGIKGQVVIQFVVSKQGEITKVKIARDPGGGCGQEAERVVELMNNMPEKWIAGKQRGRPVNVQFTLPIKFRLDN